MLFNRHDFEPRLPTREEALKGRDTRPFEIPEQHRVLGNRLEPPFPEGLEVADFGLGCFWGAERKFWQAEGVWTTAVGYQGGYTENPTYEEVCDGRTGHAEVVRVVYDPSVVSYARLLKLFWESHDPTQGHRQGNDEGTQYRSAAYTHGPGQQRAAEASRDAYQEVLAAAGLGTITSEIRPADTFHYAEAYHQQYLDRVPNGYCGLGGTGVGLADPTSENWAASCPIGIAPATD